MKTDLSVLYNLNIKERLIIAAVMLLAAGYAVYNLIIPPAVFHYRTAARQLFVQTRLIESRERKTKNLLRLETGFEDLKKRMLSQKEMFFTGEEAADFLKGLDIVAVETKNDLKKIRPLAVEILSDSNLSREPLLCYKKAVVDVSARGGYKDILGLFNRLAGYKKLLGVSQLDLKQAEGSPFQLEAGFNLNIYIFGEK